MPKIGIKIVANFIQVNSLVWPLLMNTVLIKMKRIKLQYSNKLNCVRRNREREKKNIKNHSIRFWNEKKSKKKTLTKKQKYGKNIKVHSNVPIVSVQQRSILSECFNRITP